MHLACVIYIVSWILHHAQLTSTVCNFTLQSLQPVLRRCCNQPAQDAFKPVNIHSSNHLTLWATRNDCCQCKCTHFFQFFPVSRSIQKDAIVQTLLLEESLHSLRRFTPEWMGQKSSVAKQTYWMNTWHCSFPLTCAVINGWMNQSQRSSISWRIHCSSRAASIPWPSTKNMHTVLWYLISHLCFH